MSLSNVFAESVKTFDLREFITNHWASVMGEKDWRPFVYGGLASCAAEFGTFPIDTTKTRLQIQGQTIDDKYRQLRYRGMTDALIKISKQEGVAALYSGISPAVLRQATYGTIKFGTYYSLKELFDGSKEEHAGVNIGCAVIAGIISSSIANPTDVLKVRMQVVGTESRLGLFACFKDIYKQEGVRGLWRGVLPTSQRAAVIAAVELPVYDACKQHLIPVFGNTATNHFVSSFVASLGSAVASTPLDVVKTRLMNQRKFLTPNSQVQVYRGSFDCMVKTVKSEGPMALYKGFVPTWLRMGPWNIIFFITYEKLKKLY